MSDCEFHTSCEFFSGKLPAMPADAEALKQSYCLSNPLHCARYLVGNALGADKMPQDLLPGDKARAYGMVAGS